MIRPIVMCLAVLWLLCVRAASAAELSEIRPQAFPEARLLYVDFWASWCVPCRASFPWLNEMQIKYADQGLKVIGVNVDRQRRDAEAFLARYPAQFDLLMDHQGELAERYALQGMPSAILLGSDGTELERHIGFRADHVDQYEKTIQQLLLEQAKP